MGTAPAKGRRTGEMGHVMHADILDRIIQGIQARLAELEQRAGERGAAQNEVQTAALAEISTAIEELRGAEQELRAQNSELEAALTAMDLERRRYQDLFDFAPDAYLVTDIEGVIREANASAERLLHAPVATLTNQPLAGFVAYDDRPVFASGLERLRQGDRLEDWQLRFQTLVGSTFDASVTACGAASASLQVQGDWGEDEGRPIALRWLIRDITEQKAAEAHARQAAENERLYQEAQRQVEEAVASRERLREMSRRLVEVQEGERRRIARELHDELGQSLTGLRLALQLSQDEPADQARQHVQEAQALATELMNQVRELSLELRPAILDDLGLLQALAWHLERYTAQTQIRVRFRHTGIDGRRFAPAIETAVYRIVQEALTNIARHAGVQEAAVRVWANGDTLRAQIEDLGAGFDPQQALAGRTGGLSGMRERAALHGAELVIESAPGEGARLTVEFGLLEPADQP